MKVYKKLEDSLNDKILVSDILNYCKEAEKSCALLAKRALSKASEGNDHLLSCYAWFSQQENLYKHEIPNIVRCIINEPLQTEEDRE